MKKKRRKSSPPRRYLTWVLLAGAIAGCTGQAPHPDADDAQGIAAESGTAQGTETIDEAQEKPAESGTAEEIEAVNEAQTNADDTTEGQSQESCGSDQWGDVREASSTVPEEVFELLPAVTTQVPISVARFIPTPTLFAFYVDLAALTEPDVLPLFEEALVAEEGWSLPDIEILRSKATEFATFVDFCVWGSSESTNVLACSGDFGPGGFRPTGEASAFLPEYADRVTSFPNGFFVVDDEVLLLAESTNRSRNAIDEWLHERLEADHVADVTVGGRPLDASRVIDVLDFRAHRLPMAGLIVGAPEFPVLFELAGSSNEESGTLSFDAYLVFSCDTVTATVVSGLAEHLTTLADVEVAEYLDGQHLLATARAEGAVLTLSPSPRSIARISVAIRGVVFSVRLRRLMADEGVGLVGELREAIETHYERADLVPSVPQTPSDPPCASHPVSGEGFLENENWQALGFSPDPTRFSFEITNDTDTSELSLIARSQLDCTEPLLQIITMVGRYSEGTLSWGRLYRSVDTIED